MTENRREKIKNIFIDNGMIVKAAILRQNKLCSRDIKELINDGCIRKIKTGYYSWIKGANELTDIEIAAGIIPQGVICLFSAAEIYGLTTVNPMSISMEMPSNILKPVLPDYPPIELYVSTEAHFLLGIKTLETENGSVKIYDMERTVCDFFKFRKKVGIDTALEVLKAYMVQRNKNLQILMEYATKLKIKSIIKPYLEALT